MTGRMVILVLLLFSVTVACGGRSESPVSPTSLSPPVVAAESDQATPTNDVGITELPPAETAAQVPYEPTPNSEPTATTVASPAEETPAALYYNLPPTQLVRPTGLYASPNRPEQIVPAEIPASVTVYVMGRNATFSHVRVVWSTGVGWVPVSYTGYNNERALLEALPVFEREPPGCAIPITTQFNINNTWTSDSRQRIAVVIDLFRSRYGAFPQSTLSLTVNGNLVESTTRQIVEQGQFSLKDVVFTLPGNMQEGDQLGYQLDTTSDEPLSFAATIFSVPQDCNWDVK